MTMYKIQLLNSIAARGLQQFPSDYLVAENVADPDALLVRSFSLHDHVFSDRLTVVGRAGAGVNNIPVEKLTRLGIPVLNTPGANANAVKELVIAGMLLACRNLCQAWDYVRHLTADDHDIDLQVENHKKKFAGFELPGKTLGVIGLGAIGVKVANSAIALGMRVIGYDPAITVKRAWELSASVESVSHLEQLLNQADFISLHVPLTAQTQHLLNETRLQATKPGVVVLNFARKDIVDTTALLAALAQKRVAMYVCDFPSAPLLGNDRIIALPHLGASTTEAEENCAVMVANQLRDYLEFGLIQNSVNFPSVDMPFISGVRIAIVNANIPNMVAQISTKLASLHLNIVDLLNKSRDEIAYTLIDVDGPVSEELVQEIASIQGVIKVRLVRPNAKN